MSRPIAWHHPKRWGSAVLIWALMAQMVVPAHAFVSQLPGVYTTPPDVNVMFTLDDSGSMYSEVIPDLAQKDIGLPVDADSGADIGDGFGSQFPALWYERVDGTGKVEARSGYLSVKYYDSTNAAARFLRSSAGNPLYYDPQVRYRPWPTAADDTKVHANANPTAVNIHPADPFNATRTIDITTRRGEAGADNETTNFWPATYFVYTKTADLTTDDLKDSSTNNATAIFTKNEIKPSVTSYARGAERTDCTGTTCSYKEEIQNFANWLQYYRTRMLMAKGGVAAAFARQGTNLRVGLATINSPDVVRLGVKQFRNDDTVTPKITNRTDFYNELYPRVNLGNTPLRAATEKVGEYFRRDNVGNPWAEDPTSGAVGTQHACRRSFHILSTDGFWNGDPASTTIAETNHDNFAGKRTPPRPLQSEGDEFSDADGSLFGISPFADNEINTLSDVAAYYWKEDLRPDLKNAVAPSNRDPAFWQHLTTYTVGLGITGSGSVTRGGSATVPTGLDAANPLKSFEGQPWLESQNLRDLLVEKKIALDWPTIYANSPQTGDDLVHASMVGRGKYFSATSPTDLANNLAAALSEAADQQLDFASLSVDSPQVLTDGKAYQATFNPSGWSGRLYAFKQAPGGSINNTPSTQTTANPDQVWEASNKMPEPAKRDIFTSTGGLGSGTTLVWDSLTPTQRGHLGNDPNVLTFLRGDPSNELSNGGTFRDRPRYRLGTVAGGVLGDIVGGSPLKGPDAGGGYDRLPTTSTSGQASYATFRSASGPLNDMRNTIFLGANDGMLHAFDLTSGIERFAYVPSTVYNVPRSTSGGLAEQKLLQLASPGYTHRFTVDGPPNVADAYIGSTWRSMLVGSTGAGARGIFAMDVTRPAVGTSGFGAGSLMWEFNEANVLEGANMGFVLAYPHVVRMRNEKWAVIFGNGYDSASGKALLYVLDAETGSLISKFEVGAAGGNGLSQPNFVLNSSREVEAIYAGDLKGNLWKFDVSSTNASSWAPAFGDSTPLFAAIGPGGKAQPISVMPEISAHPNGGAMLIFGTGKLFESSDTTNDSTNDNLSTQSIYGIWDKPAETAGIAMTTTNRNTLLQPQSLLTVVPTDSTDFRRSSAGEPSWATQRGWVLDLGGSGERVNLPAQQFRSIVFVPANTPSIADPCASGGESKIFALNPVTGAAPTFPVFDTNGDRVFTDKDRGLNVLLNGSALLTQPVFQVFGQGGATLPAGPTVQPIAALDRGQATSGRSGGVELSRASGSPPSGSTSTGAAQDPCEALLSAARSNTSILQMMVNGCFKKPRISWRQLQ